MTPSTCATEPASPSTLEQHLESQQYIINLETSIRERMERASKELFEELGSLCITLFCDLDSSEESAGHFSLAV